MGIIDTLSAGFSAVNKRLWIVLIPVLLDLFLWLGPKLTAAGPVKRLFDVYADLATRSAAEVYGQQMTAEAMADQAAAITRASEQLSQASFFSFLSWQPPSLIYAQMTNQPAGLFGLPVFGADSGTLSFSRGLVSAYSKLADQPAGLFNLPVLNVDQGLVLSGLILGMALLSILMQSAYLGLIAQAVKTGESNLALTLRKLAQNWVRLLAYIGLLVAGALLVGMPALGLATVFMLISPAISGLIFGLLFAVGVWIVLYLLFAVAAMFVRDVGPLKGSWYSFNVMRRYFWSAMGLLVLMLAIRFGLSRVWELAMANPAGVIVAILGNAYIDAGLVAAGMIYFQDRYARWQEAAGQKKELVKRA